MRLIFSHYNLEIIAGVSVHSQFIFFLKYARYLRHFCEGMTIPKTRLWLIGDTNANYTGSKSKLRMHRKNCCTTKQYQAIAYMLRECRKYFNRASHDMYAIFMQSDIFTDIARMLHKCHKYTRELSPNFSLSLHIYRATFARHSCDIHGTFVHYICDIQETLLQIYIILCDVRQWRDCFATVMRQRKRFERGPRRVWDTSDNSMIILRNILSQEIFEPLQNFSD